MDIAARVSQQSYAKRLQVGAVFVAESGALTLGYNGTLPGADNCCEVETETGNLVTKPEVFHAEINALMKMLRQGISAVNSVGYLTHSPCIECSKVIVLSGVKEICYAEQFRSSEGVDFLKKAGVTVSQYK